MTLPLILASSGRSFFFSLSVVACLVSGAGVAVAQNSPVPEVGAAGPATTVSGEAAQVANLVRLMRLQETIDVMRQEGLEYGKTLEAEMFPGSGGVQWQKVLGLIYDGPNMQRKFEASLQKHMAAAGLTGDAALAELQGFYGSELGKRAIGLELEARRALLDQSVEDAAELAWADMEAKGGTRVDLLRAFVAANDLVDSNVMGAMNANLAFYRGMAEGGAFEGELNEEQMLSDVWEQEPTVRVETEGWIYPYLALSYQPLSEADLKAYIAYSESQTGVKFNAAMFAAFDDLFSQISHDLGRAAAGQMLGEDI